MKNVCLFFRSRLVCFASAGMLVAGSLTSLAVLSAGTGHEHGTAATHHDKGSADKHSGMGGKHRHDSWQTPPSDYIAKRGKHWTDPAAAKRGQSLYTANCSSCHGADGTGSGPAAASLPHPPADLTNHFHKKTGGVGDAYLFWRISEGGAVEPFKSMQSTMPGFKGALNEGQRWDVLAYVHTRFHLGQAKKKTGGHMTDKANPHGGGDHHPHN